MNLKLPTIPCNFIIIIVIIIYYYYHFGYNVPKIGVRTQNISVQKYSIQSTPKPVKPSKRKSLKLIYKSKTFSCEYKKKSQ